VAVGSTNKRCIKFGIRPIRDLQQVIQSKAVQAKIGMSDNEKLAAGYAECSVMVGAAFLPCDVAESSMAGRCVEPPFVLEYVERHDEFEGGAAVPIQLGRVLKQLSDDGDLPMTDDIN
jgi:hypothetical protein